MSTMSTGVGALTTTVTSPIGPLRLTAVDGFITTLSMHEQRHERPLPGNAQPNVEWFRDATAQLAEYFAGERTTFDLPLKLEGTEFQRRVWQSLVTIPYGETLSYGELARRVGNVKASRAVGLANGRNPIAVIVPCHRVIGADGTLTGYGGGLERKTWLLQHERHHLATVSSSVQ